MNRNVLQRRWRPVAALMLGIAMLMSLAVLNASADVVKLKDGTVIEGEVKRMGSSYQIKTPDGQYKLIRVDDVESITVDGNSGGAGVGSGTTGRAGSGGATARPTARTEGGFTQAYWEVKKRADNVEEPVKAVTLWERHLNRKDLNESERTSAEKELATWKKLYTEGAEKVKGQWLSGDDLKKLKDQTDQLVAQGVQHEAQKNVLAAVRSYNEAIRAYPNCFPAHFRLGYLELQQSYGPGGNSHAKKARRSLEFALRLQPDNPAVLNNYGAVMTVLDEPQTGVEYLWKATQKAETEVIVGNLLFVLDRMPDRFFQASRKMAEINLQANNLRARYNRGGSLYYISDPTHGLDTEGDGGDDQGGPPGLIGNGSGFFITPDGYLLTNRHVAETDDNRYYRVRLADKDEDGNYVEYLARFIAADDDYDVALLKVDLPEGVTVPYLTILKEDYPPIQADVMTLGYPTAATASFVLQTARGQVSTTDPDGDEDFDIWLDIKTTQGNSGGPIVDGNGQVIGIITAYRKVYDSIISLAVGPRQIRDFLGDLGSDAPTLEFPEMQAAPFDAQKVVNEVRPSTLLVLIFRGSLDDDSTPSDPGPTGSGMGQSQGQTVPE